MLSIQSSYRTNIIINLNWMEIKECVGWFFLCMMTWEVSYFLHLIPCLLCGRGLLTLRFETFPYICTMRMHRYRYLWLHGSNNQLGRITGRLEGRYENEAEEDQPRLHDLWPRAFTRETELRHRAEVSLRAERGVVACACLSVCVFVLHLII